MSKSRYNVLAALIVMVLASLSCILDSPEGWDDELNSTTPEENPLIVEFETEMAKIYGEDYKDKAGETTPEPKPTATSEIEVSEIQPDEGLRPREGTCAWVLTSNSDGYPSGWVNDDVRVVQGDTDTSLQSELRHGKPGCADQWFFTYHFWDLQEIYYPNQLDELTVSFFWQNNGIADCASLAVAGGQTSLSVDLDSFQIKAQWSNINIRTNPTGGTTNSDNWTPPEGEVGDIMTITQHFSTGSYGKNIRWRYEYVCNP